VLIGQPKSITVDRQHHRMIRHLAKKNHLAIYEVMHEIVDQHISRMQRLEELKDNNINERRLAKN
jgi:hypothetical protein